MTDPLPVAEVIAERVYGGLRTARVLCVYNLDLTTATAAFDEGRD